jgi:hypothetical protein
MVFSKRVSQCCCDLYVIVKIISDSHLILCSHLLRPEGEAIVPNFAPVFCLYGMSDDSELEDYAILEFQP